MKSLKDIFKKPPKKTSIYMGGIGPKVNYRMPESSDIPKLKSGFLFTVMGGIFLFMLFPIIIDPLLHEDKYKERHEEIKAELYQSGLMPGQLKKWEDPWKKRYGD